MTTNNSAPLEYLGDIVDDVQRDILEAEGIKLSDLVPTRARDPKIAGRVWVDGANRRWAVVILRETPTLAPLLRNVGLSEYLLRIKYCGISVYERPGGSR